MTIFPFPDVGEGIHEGKLIAWKINEGDSVTVDQVLCEIETDKSIVEIPSPHAGKITKLHTAAGAIITVGNPLVTYADEAGIERPAPCQPVSPAPLGTPRPIESSTSHVEITLVPTQLLPKEQEPKITLLPDEHNQQGPALHPSIINGSGVLATPSTRKFAREHGIDIQTIVGTGPQSRVTEQDIRAKLEQTKVVTQSPLLVQSSIQQNNVSVKEPPTALKLPASTNTQGTIAAPYEGRRKAIGEHLVEAQRVPAVTVFARADATALVALRERQKAHADARGIKLTYLALFAKATLAALHTHPALNSSLTTHGIEFSRAVHLGIAVDNPKGLVVPVVHDAHTKSILELASEIANLAQRTREDTISAAELHGSTFSITSIGPQRIEGFTPMLNTPESAVLGIGAILEQPWVISGAIAVRKIVTLSLTFDHRVFDGAEAARFLTDLVLLIEDPELLLIEAS